MCSPAMHVRFTGHACRPSACACHSRPQPVSMPAKPLLTALGWAAGRRRGTPNLPATHARRHPQPRPCGPQPASAETSGTGCRAMDVAAGGSLAGTRRMAAAATAARWRRRRSSCPVQTVLLALGAAVRRASRGKASWEAAWVWSGERKRAFDRWELLIWIKVSPETAHWLGFSAQPVFWAPPLACAAAAARAAAVERGLPGFCALLGRSVTCNHWQSKL